MYSGGACSHSPTRPPMYAATAVSYAAVCAKARAARLSRVTARCPPAQGSASTSSYCDGETTTATDALFLAAARIMVGPPISMFSMVVAASAPRATVSTKG